MKRRLFAAAGLVLAAVYLSGCNSKPIQADRTGFYFDTAVSLRVYGRDADAIADHCMEECARLELILSAQNEQSELYTVNHRDESVTSVELSEDLASCLSTALYYSDYTEGKFQATTYPLTSLWDFHAEDPTVPDENAITNAIAEVDDNRITLTGRSLTFSDGKQMIDLGAVAKGYISGALASYLESEDVDGAIINLGGNVRTVGVKPDGSKWNVGIQKPFADRGELLTTVQVDAGTAVISSGVYERYFEKDGKFYHHILDASTGYPVDTALKQVSVIGSSDADCDALATIGILLGKDKTEQLMEELGRSETLIFTLEDLSMVSYSVEDGESSFS